MSKKLVIGWKDGDKFEVIDNGSDSEVGHRFSLMCNGGLMLHTDSYHHVLQRLEYETCKPWSTVEEAGIKYLISSEEDSELFHWKRS